MHQSLEDVVAGWSGAAVITRYDRQADTWMFIAIHDRRLGRPSGGTRMKTYASVAAGLQDAMRLAEGMTSKWAALGLPRGGGKAVLATPGPVTGDVRVGLLRRYGELLGTLRGAFATGPDLGTTPSDMAVIRQVTPYVHGVGRDGTLLDSGPYTAQGVLAGIRAALQEVFGRDGLAGRIVVVEGVGAVGAPLTRLLAQAGARVTVTDIDGARAARIAAATGVDAVPPHVAHEMPCDVYAPCAVGAILSQDTIPGLHCRIVAGSANNQLAEPADAARLHARGILYAPDYIINAGGAIALTLSGPEPTEGDIAQRIADIGTTLGQIFRESAARGESPVRAAERRVRHALDQALGHAGETGTNDHSPRTG